MNDIIESQEVIVNQLESLMEKKKMVWIVTISGGKWYGELVDVSEDTVSLLGTSAHNDHKTHYMIRIKAIEGISWFDRNRKEQET